MGQNMARTRRIGIYGKIIQYLGKNYKPLEKKRKKEQFL